MNLYGRLLAAIFFMTYFYRAGWAWGPPGSATVKTRNDESLNVLRYISYFDLVFERTLNFAIILMECP